MNLNMMNMGITLNGGIDFINWVQVNVLLGGWWERTYDVTTSHHQWGQTTEFIGYWAKLLTNPIANSCWDDKPNDVQGKATKKRGVNF